ncbi:hypothetical protein G4G28_15415 [Massilia sp. Dwa41.01b]|uniref:hypothetical protein n=1 Tax=unclassified Massilia TaxID=2609279 RepID=UPI0016013EA7|nr:MULTISPECIES: hypothetical protein [unclassified Massilia]QNA89511.1 hypothetical protein G4G28_15415 [Massilia sp. Dwa41.01b]QNB00411.1 hypothetical protein G4G31_19000 [Massilia sp. Se16.2.3]
MLPRGPYVTLEFVDTGALLLELLAHRLELFGQFRGGLRPRRKGAQCRADGQCAKT